MKTLLIFSVFCVLSSAEIVQAVMCSRWQSPQKIGELDNEIVPEASGLAISQHFEDRLYHVNDQGNEPAIIVTSQQGQTLQTVRLTDFDPVDTEELALGPCGNQSCLYIGDIGDNQQERPYIQIGWITEKSKFGKSEKLRGLRKLYYPNGSHNAEAMIVHPQTGDLFIFTKGLAKDSKQEAEPSFIFRMAAEDLQTGSNTRLQLVGQIDLPTLLSDYDSPDQVATGAALSIDGESLLILTYKSVVQIKWDQLETGKGSKVLNLNVLKKQEAIAWMPGTNSFLVTTESKKKNGSILQITCQN